MSYYLRKNGKQVAISAGWNAQLFTNHTGTSFPYSVPQGWSWDHDDWSLTWEDDPAPPPPTAEELLALAKARRAEEVAAITVTTQAGNTFDGHEDAQNRMSRAVLAMSDTDVLPWVLADNSIAQVSRAELQEALRLAGLAMAELWIKPYLPE